MKKDVATIVGLFIIIVLLLIFGQGFTSVGFLKQASPSGQLNVQRKGYTSVSVKTLNVNAKVASNANDRKKGLSALDSLPLNEGMLFVFDTKGPYVFWMKDMKFAIDIIWVDENKKIIYIANDVPPEPGRKDDQLTRYMPSGGALYVLEVNAGLAKLNGLEVGNSLNLEI